MAFVIKAPSLDDEEILVVRQSAPFIQGEEYQRYLDSDLWDLPSAPLKLLENGAEVDDLAVDCTNSCSDVDWRKFDLLSAIDQVNLVNAPTFIVIWTSKITFEVR